MLCCYNGSHCCTYRVTHTISNSSAYRYTNSCTFSDAIHLSICCSHKFTERGTHSFSDYSTDRGSDHSTIVRAHSCAHKCTDICTNVYAHDWSKFGAHRVAHCEPVGSPKRAPNCCSFDVTHCGSYTVSHGQSNCRTQHDAQLRANSDTHISSHACAHGCAHVHSHLPTDAT